MTENKKNELAITKVALFEGKKIRKVFHQNEWWFSIVDVIEVLTDSTRPRKYWSDLKTKLVQEGYFEVSEKIGQLKICICKTIFQYAKITPCSQTHPASFH